MAIVEAAGDFGWTFNDSWCVETHGTVGGCFLDNRFGFSALGIVLAGQPRHVHLSTSCNYTDFSLDFKARIGQLREILEGASVALSGDAVRDRSVDVRADECRDRLRQSWDLGRSVALRHG